MSYAAAVDISQFPNLHQALSSVAFALDIGGSLAKLVYKRVFRYRRSIPRRSLATTDTNILPFDFYDYTEHEHEGQKLCFIKFETRLIEECLDFIRLNIIPSAMDGNGTEITKKPLRIKVTGGGAYRFRDLICERLGVELDKEDEMDCLVRGCVFMLRNIPEELFCYDKNATPAHVFVSNCMVDTLPFLLVNIGSGVSILKVESASSYQRVGGTSIGGGTFWGLGTLLSGGKFTFDELLEMANLGDHRHVDMLVRDIYGGAYDTLGLSADVIASSFGLAARQPQQPREVADMVKSLLITVSNNIGQLACLFAQQHQLTRIIFGGFFIRGHELTMEVITYAVRFWSKGKYRALFLRHEGYLGAIGAFLKTFEDNSHGEPKALWAENYVTSPSNSAIVESPLSFKAESLKFEDNINQREQNLLVLETNDESNESVIDKSDSKGFSSSPSLKTSIPVNKQNMSPVGSTLSQVSKQKAHKRENPDIDHFELDRVFTHSLELFPLLESPANYSPDTWDLTQDKEARVYWLDCLEKSVECHRIKAEESQADTFSDASERSYQYAERYISFLRELKGNPSGRGVLTVRCLLSAQQHFLREFGFGDAFCLQKKHENRAALAALPARLKELSELNWSDRQLALVMGLLAGDVFDWGSGESVQFMKNALHNKYGVVDFKVTLDRIESRPWLMDDYEEWIKRINPYQEPYRCVLIFCDNSGADILLGLLPFALEFLNRGSRVILAANSSPAINDITYDELELLLRMVASFEPSVADALINQRLILAENGQTSPCLDFRLIASSLVQLVEREKVDLIIIKGMGRAVHCNLNARFLVDTLKAAVIKNSWLACKLGGKLYSVLFKFEPVGCDQTLKEFTFINGV